MRASFLRCVVGSHGECMVGLGCIERHADLSPRIVGDVRGSEQRHIGAIHGDRKLGVVSGRVGEEQAEDVCSSGYESSHILTKRRVGGSDRPYLHNAPEGNNDT